MSSLLPLYKSLCVVLTLCLSSCLEVREEIWVNRSGGGRFMLDYTVPRQAVELAGGEAGVRRQIDTLLTEIPSLELDSFQIRTDGRDAMIHAELSSPSLLELVDSLSQDSTSELPTMASQLIGSFEVAFDGPAIRFQREIDLAAALGFAAFAIPAAEQDRRTMTYILHLPKAATSHNATRTEASNRTLIWEQPLRETLGRPLEMRFRAPLPIPWYGVGGLLLLMLVSAILIRAIRRHREARPNSNGTEKLRILRIPSNPP